MSPAGVSFFFFFREEAKVMEERQETGRRGDAMCPWQESRDPGAMDFSHVTLDTDTPRSLS